MRHIASIVLAIGINLQGVRMTSRLRQTHAVHDRRTLALIHRKPIHVKLRWVRVCQVFKHTLRGGLTAVVHNEDRQAVWQ
jgi:hypothetical protein